MGGGQSETPRGWQADTGQESHKANAAGTCKIAQTKGRAKRAALYHIQPEGGEPFAIYAKGRNAWALDRLREAGPHGCTPITEPAPRWSAYVFNLRGLGVPIDTVTELHGGEFSGTHGRYVLRAVVQKGGAA
jgi:selenocysteine lyase/cysteine desulfurase